jgi:hypothetical protein
LGAENKDIFVKKKKRKKGTYHKELRVMKCDCRESMCANELVHREYLEWLHVQLETRRYGMVFALYQQKFEGRGKKEV